VTLDTLDNSYHPVIPFPQGSVFLLQGREKYMRHLS
jgi:hypothetical protein